MSIEIGHHARTDDHQIPARPRGADGRAARYLTPCAAGKQRLQSPALARALALSRSGMLLADATSPRREPRVTASAATAASFSVIFAMIASLARSNTPRFVATKCCDCRRPAR